MMTRRYRSFKSRSREPSAFQRNEGTQFRRNHRNHVEHHPLGAVGTFPSVLFEESTDHAHALDGFLALLHRSFDADLVAQEVSEFFDIDHAEQGLDRLAADLGDELIGVVVVQIPVIRGSSPARMSRYSSSVRKRDVVPEQRFVDFLHRLGFGEVFAREQRKDAGSSSDPD